MIKMRVKLLMVVLLSTAGAGVLASAPDYELLDELLLHNVRHGLVDYDSLSVDPRFGMFVSQLGAATADAIDEPRAELAFYLNAYNVLAIQSVLDGRQSSGGRSHRRFVTRSRYRIMGEELSLQEIERDRIMPLGDSRSHFAIVAASLSSPRLWNRAYRAEDLNEQLDEAARRFINDPTRNRFDVERRVAFLSPLFEASHQEFDAARGSLQRYLADYVANPDAAKALREDEFTVRYQQSDWILNGHFSGGGRPR
jgi:hypothetical protein